MNNAEIKGLEASIDFYTGPINHKFVAEWIDSKDKGTDKALKRIPEQKFAWNLNYYYDDFNMSISTLYTGERVDSSDKNLDAYTTVDLGAGYQVNDSLELALRVNNLFDKEYETGYGSTDSVTKEEYYYIGEGRTVFLTGNYQFNFLIRLRADFCIKYP